MLRGPQLAEFGWDRQALTGASAFLRGPFEGAYTGRGAVGQWISVFPALDLVIAHKTNSVYGRTTSWRAWQRLVELLLEAHGVEMPGPYPWSG